VREAVSAVVTMQRNAGLDVVNDGEQGKPSYLTYVKDRVEGFEYLGDTGPFVTLDDRDFPEFAAEKARAKRWRRPTCTGPLGWKGREAVVSDIATLREALGSEEPEEAFMTAVSPGVACLFAGNQFYDTEDEYVFAMADVLKYEYDAIHRAGFLLQLDCPDLAGGRTNRYAEMSDKDFLGIVELHVEALNHAVRDIPPDRMRIHVCWGNLAGPHHRDVPLADIVDILLKARPDGLSIEGANPRHGHEWAVFERVKLPGSKVLLPGVIDSTTNFIEHPELVAQRIVRYADVVGRASVIASTDCGMATSASLQPQVDTRIAWAKLEALTEGARLATEALWKDAPV
jgi:5-methyltetrahydropteroyltriglutamate--homocysteine methyltransferase